jgi:hypothetical protein
MAKGSIAKQNVVMKLAQVFGSDFVGEYDKKVYVWADDGGEKVQIAISMTCPKNPIGEINYSAEPGNKLNFEDMSAGVIAPAGFEPAEISEDEKRNIAEMMERLGL